MDNETSRIQLFRRFDPTSSINLAGFSMNSNQTPGDIDGAKVILFTKLTSKHRQTGFTTHFVNMEQKQNPHGLAICRYDGDPGYYLFYCDNDWEVLNDTYHESEEEAIEQAELEFVGTKETWLKGDS